VSSYRFSIDVPVENRWDNVERVRLAVQSCFEAVFHDIPGRDAVAMVTGELLENAIKYGDWSNGQGVFRLRVWGDQRGSAIAVTNPVATSSTGPARVREAIEFIQGHADALSAYQARLVAVATGGRTGGLGLVRVAYEGGCHLTVQQSGDELTVTASRQQPFVGVTQGASAHP
jgi:hypothetical protein